MYKSVRDSGPWIVGWLNVTTDSVMVACLCTWPHTHFTTVNNL